MEKLALTLKQAAESAGVSVTTMRILANQPGFPAFRVGRRWVIPIDAFQEWMHDQATMRKVH